MDPHPPSSKPPPPASNPFQSWNTQSQPSQATEASKQPQPTVPGFNIPRAGERGPFGGATAAAPSNFGGAFAWGTTENGGQAQGFAFSSAAPQGFAAPPLRSVPVRHTSDANGAHGMTPGSKVRARENASRERARRKTPSKAAPNGFSGSLLMQPMSCSSQSFSLALGLCVRAKARPFSAPLLNCTYLP